MIYAFEDFELDTGRFELRHEGKPRHVEPQVYNLLRYLLEHRDRVVTQDELLDNIWGHRFVTPATLNSRVKSARRALADDGTTQRVIRTVRGRGFRFVAEVRPLSGSTATVERVDDAEVRSGARTAFSLVGGSPPRTGSRSTDFEDDRSRGTPLPGFGSRSPDASDPDPGGHDPGPVPDLPAERDPEALGEAPRPELIARDRELDRLGRLLGRACQGDRQIAFIAGDLGIGKSALIDEFTTEVRRGGGIRVARGQCLDQRGPREPYLPLLDAFSRLCRNEKGGVPLRILERWAPTWLAQMPSLLSEEALEAVQRRAFGATRDRMLREMVEALEGLTAAVPLVLVLEELHWSDASTLDLLSWAGTRMDPARLLLLGTYRSGEGDVVLQRVISKLRGLGRCVELRLAPWNQADILRYLRSRFGGEESDRVAELILERSGGNPLFVGNIVDAWIETGILRIDGGWKIDDGAGAAAALPQGLRALIEERIERLSQPERRLIEAASVAGRTFSAALVAAAVKEEEEETEAALETLAGQEWMIRGEGTTHWPDGTMTSRFSFVHHLYQEVLYDRLPPGRRARLHECIGDRLEMAFGEESLEHAGRLAHHFQRTRNGERAIHYLTLAGEQAAARSAHQSAIAHLTAAIEILRRSGSVPDAAARELRLQRMLGSVLLVTRGCGDPDAVVAYRRARELSEKLGDVSELAHVLSGMAYLHEFRGDFNLSQALIEERLGLEVGTEDPMATVEAEELLSCSLFHQGAFEDAEAHASQALQAIQPERYISFFPPTGHHPAVGCYQWKSLALWFLGQVDSAREPMERALRFSDTREFIYMKPAALVQLARLCQLRGEPEDAAALAGEGLTLAEGQSSAYDVAFARTLLGWAQTRRGEIEEGIRTLQRGIREQVETGADMERPYSLGLLAEAFLAADRTEEGLAVIEDALEIVRRRTRTFFWEAELFRLRGELRLREVRPAPDRPPDDPPRQEGSSRQPPDRLEDAAEGDLRRALEISRKQKSLSLELRATLSLGRLLRLQGRNFEAAEEVLSAYRRFTEGFDTRDLQEARAFIG